MCAINSADIIWPVLCVVIPLALISSKVRHSYMGVFLGKGPPPMGCGEGLLSYRKCIVLFTIKVVQDPQFTPTNVHSFKLNV